MTLQPPMMSLNERLTKTSTLSCTCGIIRQMATLSSTRAFQRTEMSEEPDLQALWLVKDVRGEILIGNECYGTRMCPSRNVRSPRRVRRVKCRMSLPLGTLLLEEMVRYPLRYRRQEDRAELRSRRRRRTSRLRFQLGLGKRMSQRDGPSLVLNVNCLFNFRRRARSLGPITPT